MIPALEQMFPQVPIKGGLFHLCKNIYKRVQRKSLLIYVSTMLTFRQKEKWLVRTALYQYPDKIEAFEELADIDKEQAQSLDYFWLETQKAIDT